MRKAARKARRFSTSRGCGDEQDDRWVINGQKIWTTTYWGQYMFLAARTDREAKPAHAGISMPSAALACRGVSAHIVEVGNLSRLSRAVRSARVRR